MIDEVPVPFPSTAPPVLVPGLGRRVHLLGAGGAGVSGLGLLLAGCGHEVTGHDRERSPFLRAMEAAGIGVVTGESGSSALPAGVEVVVRSAAVPDQDPAVVEALERGLPVLRYKQALGLVAAHRTRAVAVAGTHGKTSTTWLLQEALEATDRALKLEVPDWPASGVLAGGLHRGRGCNAWLPEEGGLLAVEACEYDRTFLELEPLGAIVTNLEDDHLDYYGTRQNLEAAFARFVAKVDPKGLLVLSADAPQFLESAARCEVWREGREFQLELHGEERGRFRIRVVGPGWASPVVTLEVPGRFNADNAACAVAMAVGLHGRGRTHLPPADLALAAARGAARFEGAGRRFESWGDPGGVALVHDYAHHPTEVRVTLEAARRVFPGKEIHVLFQPHQASRTARLLPDFIESLRSADRVVVADVYGARKHIDTVTAGAAELVAGLVRAGIDAVEGGDLAHATAAFAGGLHADCAGLVLGAGDVETVRGPLVGALGS